MSFLINYVLIYHGHDSHASGEDFHGFLRMPSRMGVVSRLQICGFFSLKSGRFLVRDAKLRGKHGTQARNNREAIGSWDAERADLTEHRLVKRAAAT